MKKLTKGFLWKIELTDGKTLISKIWAKWIENPIGYHLRVETEKNGKVYRISKIFEKYIDMKKYAEVVLGKIKLSATGEIPAIFKI